MNLDDSFLQTEGNELLKVRMQRELQRESHKTITVTLGNASEVTVVYADGPGPALNCPLYRLIHTE